MTTKVSIPPYLNLGLSGTRRDPTKRQKEVVVGLVTKWQPLKGHHGDCTGFDRFAHYLLLSVVRNPMDLEVYPPVEEKWRAFCEALPNLPHRVHIHEPAPYLTRDTTIVQRSAMLLAVPSTVEETTFSGTWSTIRRARKAERPIIIVRPDGVITREGRWP